MKLYLKKLNNIVNNDSDNTQNIPVVRDRVSLLRVQGAVLIAFPPVKALYNSLDDNILFWLLLKV